MSRDRGRDPGRGPGLGPQLGRGPPGGEGLRLWWGWGLLGGVAWRRGGAQPEKRVRKEAGVGLEPGLGGVLKSDLLPGLVQWAALGPGMRQGLGWPGAESGSKVASGGAASLEPRWMGLGPTWGRGLSPSRERGGAPQARSRGGWDLRSGPLPAVTAHPPILSPLRQVSSRELL